MKKNLARFRRAVLPVRDILGPILRGDLQLFGADEMPYYRDVLDHVSRVAEQLDEEELAIFDILTRPELDMTADDRKQVKLVARKLLQTLKEAKLVLEWRKKLRTRADVYSTVKTVLDDLPRIYSVDLYRAKCDSVYRHVYDSYQGEGKSVYQVV